MNGIKRILAVEAASYRNRRVKLTDGKQSEWVSFPSILDLRDLRFGNKYEFEFGKSLIEGKIEIRKFREAPTQQRAGEESK